MKTFYQERYNLYRNMYWDIEQHDFLKANGFTIYPTEIYNLFTRLINLLSRQSIVTVLDVCCGNGLLLKHLMEFCDSQVIPFGIDFMEPSIEQARTKVHLNYKNNFFLANAVDFNFSDYYFDFVLLDPYHFKKDDLEKLILTITKNTSNSIFFYCYSDVLKLKNFKSVLNFPVLKKLRNLKLFSHQEISIGVLNINII